VQQSLSWVPPPVDAGTRSGPTLSWVPPPELMASSTLHFVSASASRQHPAKTKTGIVNADAVMEAPRYLGVCDGVSGVHHLGIPPDELPLDLLRSCKETLVSQGGQHPVLDDGTWFTGLIEEAFDATRAYGATTLLLAALRDSNLVTASLGDCAVLVLRPCSFSPFRLRPIFKTEPGRYDSRRPVQVQRLHGFSDANAHAVIKGAMVSTTPVQHGDILILGSDGLFDNLRDDDIQHAVETCCTSALAQSSLQRLQAELSGQPCRQEPIMPSPAQLQRVAAALVDLAIASVRLDRTEDAHSMPWGIEGGEVPANNADDTTALVAVVVAEARPAATERLESCAGVIDDIAPSRPVLGDRTNIAPGEEKGWRAGRQKPSAGGRSHDRHPSSARAGSVDAARFRNASLSPPRPGSSRTDRRRQGHCELHRDDCVIS